jgi:hypothetical protein
MNIKVARSDASGFVGARVKVIEPTSPYFNEEGVVTNALPGTDGKVWSLHVRLTYHPHMEAPLVLAPDEIARVDLLN